METPKTMRGDKTSKQKLLTGDQQPLIEFKNELKFLF